MNNSKLEQAFYIVISMSNMKYVVANTTNNSYIFISHNNKATIYDSVNKCIDMMKDYILFNRIGSDWDPLYPNIKNICDTIPRHILKLLLNKNYDEIIEKYGMLL